MPLRTAHPPLRLCLVRHGQSEWNAVARLQGQTRHVGLTALGRDQARSAARLLAAMDVDLLLTSDLARAAQTAEAVAEATGLTARVDLRLREQCYGELEGRTLAEVDRTPVDFDDPGERIGGGESFDDVRVRIGSLLEEYLNGRCGPAGADGPGEPAARGVVLVTHGETIRAALAWLAARGGGAVPERVPSNGSITTIWMAGGRVTRSEVVLPEPVRPPAVRPDAGMLGAPARPAAPVAGG